MNGLRILRSTIAVAIGFAIRPATVLTVVAASAAALPQTEALADSAGARVAAQARVLPAVQGVGADSFSDLQVKFAGGVVGYPNVVYQTLVGYRPTTLDLFLPPSRFASKGPRPLVVYVHGGGFVGGGPRRSSAFADWPKVLASIAAEGYVVATVAYRFAGEAPFPAQIQDVKAAIRFLRANAAKYHIDPARAAIFGQSAGGHLAALATVSCGVAAFEPPARSMPNAPNVEVRASTAEGADAVSDCVQAGAAWFGVYDMVRQVKATVAGGGDAAWMKRFAGCDSAVCTDEKLRATSPVTYVDAKDPPLYLMHGDADTTVLLEQSQLMKSALESAGVPTHLTVVPGTGHSWIGGTPAVTESASRQALVETLDFIERTIGR